MSGAQRRETGGQPEPVRDLVQVQDSSNQGTRRARAGVDGPINPRGTRWTFTVNNYTEDDVEALKDLFEKIECSYWVFGREIAPTTGTRHLQGYFRTQTRIYRNTLTSRFHFSYLVLANGSEYKNREYCTKDGDFEESNEKDCRGKPAGVTADERCREMLKDIQELNEMEFEAKWPREAFYHGNRIKEWKIRHTPQKQAWNGNLKEKNIWIWGEPGCGKSRWAEAQVGILLVYKKPWNKWWDGFLPGGHRCVIIEDVPKDAVALTYHMKIWADRYPFVGEIKGGSININPGDHFLIVTSNYSIEEALPGAETDVEAIKRRFHEVHIQGPEDIFLTTRLDKTVIGLTDSPNFPILESDGLPVHVRDIV